MRFEINLASHPYQDVRRFLMQWGLVAIAALLITLGLLYSAVAAIRSWHSTKKEVLSLQQAIAERDRQRAAAQDLLGRPENRETRDRGKFLNLLFERKAFSWTEVFVDLEKLMPAQLHVTSIRPTVNDQNELELHLAVSGTTRDAAIELVRRLEQSPHFSRAEILSERSETAQSGRPGVQFDISAIYIPPFQRSQTQQSNAAQPLNSAAANPAAANKGNGPVEARNAQH